VRHPADNHFAWSRGRTLEALQVVVVTAGRGESEQRGDQPQRLETGDAFLRLPGGWHRYRPDPARGWVESWVELAGEPVDRLVRRKALPKKSPVLRNAFASGMEGALAAVHARARQPARGFDTELAA
jgi:hypothetical protein